MAVGRCAAAADRPRHGQRGRHRHARRSVRRPRPLGRTLAAGGAALDADARRADRRGAGAPTRRGRLRPPSARRAARRHRLPAPGARRGRPPARPDRRPLRRRRRGAGRHGGGDAAAARVRRGADGGVAGAAARRLQAAAPAAPRRRGGAGGAHRHAAGRAGAGARERAALRCRYRARPQDRRIPRPARQPAPDPGTVARPARAQPLCLHRLVRRLRGRGRRRGGDERRRRGGRDRGRPAQPGPQRLRPARSALRLRGRRRGGLAGGARRGLGRRDRRPAEHGHVGGVARAGGGELPAREPAGDRPDPPRRHAAHLQLLVPRRRAGADAPGRRGGPRPRGAGADCGPLRRRTGPPDPALVSRGALPQDAAGGGRRSGPNARRPSGAARRRLPCPERWGA